MPENFSGESIFIYGLAMLVVVLFQLLDGRQLGVYKFNLKIHSILKVYRWMMMDVFFQYSQDFQYW